MIRKILAFTVLIGFIIFGLFVSDWIQSAIKTESLLPLGGLGICSFIGLGFANLIYGEVEPE